MAENDSKKRTFRRYKLEVTVLVDREIPEDWSLQDIAIEGDDGSFVIDYSSEGEVISSKDMADALYEARSEPGFFGLDDDGNDVDD